MYENSQLPNPSVLDIVLFFIIRLTVWPARLKSCQFFFPRNWCVLPRASSKETYDASSRDQFNPNNSGLRFCLVPSIFIVRLTWFWPMECLFDSCLTVWPCVFDSWPCFGQKLMFLGRAGSNITPITVTCVLSCPLLYFLFRSLTWLRLMDFLFGSCFFNCVPMTCMLTFWPCWICFDQCDVSCCHANIERPLVVSSFEL